MEEQKPPAPEMAKAAPKRRALWIAIAVIVVVVIVVAAALLGGLFAGAKPQAIFFVGYPGEGDKLIPTWWNNRAQWPAAWLGLNGCATRSRPTCRRPQRSACCKRKHERKRSDECRVPSAE